MIGLLSGFKISVSLKSCKNSSVNANIKTLNAIGKGLMLIKLFIKQYMSITTKTSPKVERINPLFKYSAIDVSISNKPMKQKK